MPIAGWGKLQLELESATAKFARVELKEVANIPTVKKHIFLLQFALCSEYRDSPIVEWNASQL